MTLTELITWHRGQRDIHRAQASEFASRAGDRRSSKYTRGLYVAEQRKHEALITHHNAAIALLETLK